MFPGCCSQWFKDTKMKANHNRSAPHWYWNYVVPNGSKILKWKQITTIGFYLFYSTWLFPMVQRYQNESKSQLYRYPLPPVTSCSQWFKDTKMKANHNYRCHYKYRQLVVPNGSKILKWKQITTIHTPINGS